MSTPRNTTGMNVCSTNYSFTVSVEDFTTIDDWDHEQPEYVTTLGDRLDSIEGVDNAEYNGHFGSHIFFTLGAEEDNSATHDQIYKLITSYIEEARRNLK